MTLELRRQVRALYHFACGYCGVLEVSVGAELTIDHFQPRSVQGTDDLENLVYACPACNQFKSETWSIQPDQQLLHPLRDIFFLHLVEQEDATLRSLTARGRHHRDILHLNRPELIAHRLARRERARERAAIDELEKVLAEAEQRLDELEQLLFASKPPRN